MIRNRLITGSLNGGKRDAIKPFFFINWIKSEKGLLTVLLVLAACTWIPRLIGPLDLRYDSGVYYVLGTSFAEGKGYKLLNEPGEINAVQYPPLLPLIIAGYQLVLQTSDPTIVGGWLRLSAILLFIGYIYAVFRLSKHYLSLPYAFLASLLCLFSLNVYFLSNFCLPEIPFSLATILFFLCNRKEGSRRYATGAYLFALAAYALRTIGIAVLMVWFLESVIKRRFRQAMIRAALVIIPVMCWQLYIASVEKSYDYNHPAYSYQRAPYLFYNVSYSRNIALEDPLAPEKGKARVVRRAMNNVGKVTLKLGESVITPYYYFWVSKALKAVDRTKTGSRIISWFNVVVLYAFAFAVLAGLVLQLFRRQFAIPLFVFASLAAIGLTPFLDQYFRYLMPLTPYLILSLILFLLAVKNAALRNLSEKWNPLTRSIVVVPLLFILILEIATFTHVYYREFKPVEYTGINNQVIKQRLFYGIDAFNNYNLCITYLKQHARPTDVVASGMPHWLYLRTGLKAIMPPFEINTAQAQQELESVPVTYLVVGKDPIDSDRYTLPVMQKYVQKWKRVFSTPGSEWMIYQRING